MVAIPERDLPRNKHVQVSPEELRERAHAARTQTEQVTQSMSSVTLTGTSVTDTPVTRDSDAAEEVIIGLGRLYSGTLSLGQQIHVYGPKYSALSPLQHHSLVTITGLYLLMGRDLVPLTSVPAGNIFGLSGLEGKLLKNGTVSSLEPGVNLARPVGMGGQPIVRVAVEPVWPGDLDKLVRGLRMLNQADSAVEVLLQENGEHVILTAGELHLEVLSPR
jgi:ribosome assembly protein 1